MQLGLIFMQMGAVSFSVAIVDLMTAAVRWPGVALVIAVGVAGVSVLRILALFVLVSRWAPPPPPLPCGGGGAALLATWRMLFTSHHNSSKVRWYLLFRRHGPAAASGKGGTAYGPAKRALRSYPERRAGARRYQPGSAGAAKALLAMRDGWSALSGFSQLERGAIAVVGASLLPYSPMHRPAGALRDGGAEVRCISISSSWQPTSDVCWHRRHTVRQLCACKESHRGGGWPRASLAVLEQQRQRVGPLTHTRKACSCGALRHGARHGPGPCPGEAPSPGCICWCTSARTAL